MDSEKIQRPYPGAPIQVDGKHREKQVSLDSIRVKGQAKAFKLDREGNTAVGLGWRKEGDKNAVFETQICLERVG